MTQATTPKTAEQIIAKWNDIAWRSEIATSMLCNHSRRDPYGNSKEAKEWQKARNKRELMQSIMAELAEAGIVIPERSH